MDTKSEPHFESDRESACCVGPSVELLTETVSNLDTTSSDELKAFVKMKYGDIAARKTSEAASGCGCGCGSDAAPVGESYSDLEGYLNESDMGLGCGLPTELAEIREGETVLDLGSGGGIDAFIARRSVGTSGRVIGVDFTPEMVELATINVAKLGYHNVSFVHGDIEELPIEDSSVDVVVSNCVLNLVPDKKKAFAEMYRVAKPGGRFCISDIVLNGELPPFVRRSIELYAGCVAGAIQRNEYLQLLESVGFEEVDVRKERPIDLPALGLGVEAAQLVGYSGFAESITVTGRRPSSD